MNGISATSPPAFSPTATQAKANTPPFWPAFLLSLAAVFITVGIRWDISWHETVGRDSFWTAAHMVIYLGGALGGCVGGWLAIYYTFLATPEEKGATVRVFGARAPLGAWVAIWSAVAMLTSGPFDNWWHNAYGLDVKIISPPHSVLGLGMFGISFAALLMVLTRQNRLEDGQGSGLYVFVGGIFTVMSGVFIMEYTFPNMQHGAAFYEACALQFPLRLLAVGRSARTSWPVTRVAVIYMLVECLIVWILPLFPEHPKLAPIYNPVTHMVPPPFPMLLVFPALAMDVVLRRAGGVTGWKCAALALLLGAVFLVVFIPVQWFFSEFLLSPPAENWFFVGNKVWSYGDSVGDWSRQFWGQGDDTRAKVLTGLAWSWGFAAFTSWLGLLLGGWMRKVQR